jgi:hypothetical protein
MPGAANDAVIRLSTAEFSVSARFHGEINSIQPIRFRGTNHVLVVNHDTTRIALRDEDSRDGPRHSSHEPPIARISYEFDRARI